MYLSKRKQNKTNFTNKGIGFIKIYFNELQW